MRKSRLSSVLSLLWLCAFASPVLAQAGQPARGGQGEEQARAHFRLGRAHYENGDFVRAATEFEAAFQISQRPGLLYNIYLAYRDASDVPHAAEALRKYLELEKDVENRGQLSARLAAMDRALAEEAAQAAQPASTVPGSAAPQAPSPQPAATTAEPSPQEPAALPQPTAAEAPASAPAPATAPDAASSSRPNRLWPIVLMATGGVLVASSVVTGVLALGKRSELADAQAECTRVGDCSALSAVRLRQLEDTRSSGKLLAGLTDGLLFGGIAVAAAGAAWWVLSPAHEDRASESGLRANFLCLPGNCAARIALRF